MCQRGTGTTLRGMIRQALLSLAALAVVHLSCPPAGRAFEDETRFRASFGGGYACYHDARRYHGLSGSGRFDWLADPWWVLGVRAGIAQHSGKGRNFQVVPVGIAARLQLDVSEYVPYVELSPTVYFASGQGGPESSSSLGSGLGMRTGFGFDRLLDEFWSLGLAVDYHNLFPQDVYPGELELGLTLGYRFAVGDPWAP